MSTIENLAIEYIRIRRAKLDVMRRRDEHRHNCEGYQDTGVMCFKEPDMMNADFCSECRASRAMNIKNAQLAKEQRQVIRKLERAVVAGPGLKSPTEMRDREGITGPIRWPSEPHEPDGP